MSNVKHDAAGEATTVEEKKIVKKGRKPRPRTEREIEAQNNRIIAELHGNTQAYVRDISCGDEELQAMLQLYDFPPIDLDDEDAVRQRVGDYFRWAARNHAFPSLGSLALALYVDRRTVTAWGVKYRINSAHSDIIKRAKTLITAMTELKGANGSITPIYAMFLLNNSNEGFVNSNRLELTQTTTEQLDAPKMADVIDIYDIPETEDNGKR